MTRRTISLPLILLYALFGFLIVYLACWLITGERPAFGQSLIPGLTLIGPGHGYIEEIPIFDAQALGHEPVTVPAGGTSLGEGRGSEQSPGDPANPYAAIRKSGPVYASPGIVAGYAITLANYESVTRTYRLTDTLPAGLAYVPGSAAELVYDSATRILTWQGTLAPGDLDYVVETSDVSLPYLDLANFGVPNLCDEFIVAGQGCDDVAVTFNLGINGYTFNFYGEVLSQVTLSANGLALGDAPGDTAGNQWLPDDALPSHLLAGLWRDVDMTSAGRWHAAIVTGLIAGHDVFYAQWHDAPHAADPDLTARHAIAIVLGDAAAGSPPELAGHAFYIYDNVADPAGTVAQGYTIGVEDRIGLRGATYAYAPCCGDPQPPQGWPPAAGTTLHLRPVLFGAGNAYSHTFTYQTTVAGQVPETIVNTAVARSDSPDPALAWVWSSHYLYVRWQTFLPAMSDEC
ncbi:MAG: DUF11 domain-containing protein [Chloroflexi bacterium]|nr:DUF11 domain-containing protein [Chloroflexota bacterium]